MTNSQKFFTALKSGNYRSQVVDHRPSSWGAFWNAWFQPGCKARQRRAVAHINRCASLE